MDSCLRALKLIFPLFPESIARAAEIHKFAAVYAENGFWKQAHALQQKVIDVRSRVLGKRHKDTIEAQRSLGQIYWNLFELNNAINIQVENHEFAMVAAAITGVLDNSDILEATSYFLLYCT